MNVISPRDWRRTSGLSMAAAAAIGGVTGRNPSRTWQRWEKGECQPPLQVVSAIERASKGAVTIESWMKLLGAASAPHSQGADDSSGHADGSSPRPTIEISESPLRSREHRDPAVTPPAGG